MKYTWIYQRSIEYLKKGWDAKNAHFQAVNDWHNEQYAKGPDLPFADRLESEKGVDNNLTLG